MASSLCFAEAVALKSMEGGKVLQLKVAEMRARACAAELYDPFTSRMSVVNSVMFVGDVFLAKKTYRWQILPQMAMVCDR